MDEIYDEMAEKVKEIFIKEKTDPYCKYEDRLESRFEKSNLNIYAIDIPNTTYRNMSEQIKAPLQGRTIDDNYSIITFCNSYNSNSYRMAKKCSL